jgi:hypothetical protein
MANEKTPGKPTARQFVPARLAGRLLGSLPADDVVDVSTFDVINEAGNDLERFKVWLGDQELDVFAQRGSVIVDGEESEVCAGLSSQFLVTHAREAAFGVLHNDNGVNAEHVTRKRQAPKHVVGHSPSRVSDDVGLAEMQPEGREHIDASVHASDDCESSAWARVGDIGTSGRISLIAGKKPADLSHQVMSYPNLVPHGIS